MIALFDIETSSLEADTGIVLCGVVKPFKEPPKVFSLRDNPDYKNTLTDDSYLCESLRSELQKYEVVVTWNGNRFDLPYLNARYIKHEIPTYKPQTHLDLKDVAREELTLSDMSLFGIQQYFGLGKYKTTINWDCWLRAIAGYDDGWDYVIEHCARDTELLELALDRLHDISLVSLNLEDGI